jgi:signal transduction histidine kinase
MGDLAVQWGPTAALLAASGYLLLLVLALQRRGLQGAAERWFAAYLVLSIAWTVAWAFANQWGWIQSWAVDLGDRLAVYAAALLIPTLAILTLHFLSRRGAKEVTLLGLAWAVAIVLVERSASGAPERRVVLDALRYVGWVGFIIGAVMITGLEYVRVRRPLHRNRVLYWLVALIMVALGDALHYFGSASLSQLGLPFRLLGAVMMTYAIITYSLPDLKSVGRRAILQISVTLVRALLFLVAIVGAVAVFRFLQQEALDDGQIWLFVVAVGVFAALFLAVLQVPVQSIVTRAAERLLFGPGYDASRALRNYSQNISNIPHIERLATVAVRTIAEALDVERGALLLITSRDDGGADARVVPGMGDIVAMNVAFAPNSPVLQALQGASRPVTQYDLDMLPEFRSMDPAERQWQWALEVEVYVPIYAKRTLIGALALGAKQSSEPYNGQDLDVLNTLAGQTAVALENARLFDDLSRLNQDMRQLNDELIAANARLEKLDKAKTDFLNITSHELRTPLTQVRGYSDVLGNMVEEGEIDQTKMLKISHSISKAADRLQTVYTAMIDVSRIGVDALNLRMAPVKPSQFIVQAVARWQAALDQRQQVLIVYGIDELPYLEGDLRFLVQAFSNLINNAIKFTPDGGRIEVLGRVVPGPEPVVEIVVADNGIGIDPADHDLVFEKFYRAASADMHSTGDIKFMGGGPGLGLPIAKGVIEGHGGRIWVESDGHDREQCPGSRFHILLPVQGGHTDPDWLSQQLRKTRPLTGIAKRIVERAGQRADKG